MQIPAHLHLIVTHLERNMRPVALIRFGTVFVSSDIERFIEIISTIIRMDC